MNSGSPVDAGYSVGAGDDHLRVQGITVHFGGIVALDDVSLTANSRQVTGIIGPNGAGKTTLLNVLCGFVRPAAGTVSFGGRELKRIRPHRLADLGIARTLQGIGLFGGLSVIENVMVGATSLAKAGLWSGLLGLPRSDADERRLRDHAQRALELAGVGDYAGAGTGSGCFVASGVTVVGTFGRRQAAGTAEPPADRLLTAAEQLFGERSYRRTSVADICATAGIATGSFYAHFASKADIFTSVIRRINADVRAAMADALRTAPDSQRAR
jgi:ABC-type Fe3+/spermidine/putrescine transport system ATPase subunit